MLEQLGWKRKGVPGRGGSMGQCAPRWCRVLYIGGTGGLTGCPGGRGQLSYLDFLLWTVGCPSFPCLSRTPHLGSGNLARPAPPFYSTETTGSRQCHALPRPAGLSAGLDREGQEQHHEGCGPGPGCQGASTSVARPLCTSWNQSSPNTGRLSLGALAGASLWLQWAAGSSGC